MYKLCLLLIHFGMYPTRIYVLSIRIRENRQYFFIKQIKIQTVKKV